MAADLTTPRFVPPDLIEIIATGRRSRHPAAIPPSAAALDLARRCFAALDLTCLDETAPPARIEALCKQAVSPFGQVAAICVYPEYIRTAREALDLAGLGAVRVASVANFPSGRADVGDAALEVRRAVAAGADEVDVVFPWRALLAGDARVGEALVAACREACGDRARLKVILESGMLDTSDMLRKASQTALRAGADFLKTSTGKAAVHATPAAAEVMLQCIAERGGSVGFKASGGLRRLEDAAPYFALADALLGPEWATPQRFRLGASSLLDAINAELGGGNGAASGGY